MQRSESIAALAAALAKAQGQIEGARKANENPHFRSKYADLGSVWDAIREPLSSNGLAVLQELTTADGRVACTTLIVHASGEWIQYDPFSVPVSKQDAQGYGSAATYCRRYSLATIGVAPIDDDGEAAVGRSAKKSDAPPAAPQMPPGLLEAAQEAALGGTEQFRAYWKAASPEVRTALAKHIPALKEAAERADLPTEMIEAVE
jgi:hypothetical protein